MIAVMNVPKMEVAPASAAAAAEGFPEHMGALSVGIDHGYGKVEDVREQHAKELQRDKKNDEAKAEAAAAKAPLEAAPEAPADPAPADPGGDDPRRRSPHAAAAAVALRTRPGARRQYLAARAKAVEAARRRTIDKTNN